MSKLTHRITLIFTVVTALVLTGLGVVLAQFFSLVDQDFSSELVKQYQLFSSILVFLTFLMLVAIFVQLAKRYTEPFDQLTEVAEKMLRKEELRTIPDFIIDEQMPLAVTLGQLTEELDQLTISREMERERLKTLIESMGSGLLMLGRGGKVNLVNHSFCETFSVKRNDILGENVNNVSLPTTVLESIEHVFLTEQSKEIQVHLGEGEEASSVVVYAAPVIGSYGNWLGIVVVIHDITQLIRLERYRKDFVANVSHELKTPVTSIKGFTETLLAGAMHDEAVRNEFLEIIQKETNRLQLLIDDLLVLSGIEREGFSLNRTPVYIRDIVRDAVQVVSPQLEQKEMMVTLQVAPKLQAKADYERLVQVFVNLLANAITYSQPAKTIIIQAIQTEEKIQIEVQDEGVGIAPEELPRLFERFFRVDRARSRDSGGTGLGLAIVKHLMEAHDGKVEVESQLDVGTTFRLTLPKNIQEEDVQ